MDVETPVREHIQKARPEYLSEGKRDKRIRSQLLHLLAGLCPETVELQHRKIHLKGRPCEELDYEKLATLSEGYVASDITYVVNEAAMIAAFNGTEITQELMETTIKGIKPSVKGDTLKIFDNIRDRMEGNERRNSLPKVGFATD